jgi:hypothetical protein
MPRVKAKVAAKDYPDQGIRKGDTYYTWSFYRGAVQRSAKLPRGSQLTQREDHGCILQAQEGLEDVTNKIGWKFENRDELASVIRDAVSALSEGRDAAQEKLDNMPENFQQAEQGSELESLIADCESTEQELEDLADGLENYETEEDFGGLPRPEDITWPGI